MTSGGWCERTHELWFVASRAGEDLALQAVDLSGRVRLVARVLGSFWGLDVDAQGRALVSRGVERIVTMALPPGETRERDVSALDWSSLADLSADGRTLLLEDVSAESAGAVYLKRTDGPPAVRLGEGSPTSLSPDGRWALARPTKGDLAHLLLLPTGPGEARELRHPALSIVFDAHWFPDGKTAVVNAGKERNRTRLYVWELNDKPPIAISAEDKWQAVAVRRTAGGSQPGELRSELFSFLSAGATRGAFLEASTATRLGALARTAARCSCSDRSPSPLGSTG